MRAPKKQRAAPGFSWPSPRLFAALLLCAAALLAFANSFDAGFVLDSKPLLLQDPRIRQASAENIAQIFQHTYWWPTGEAGLYRPFTTLSYLANYAILGNREDPAGYHWVNFLLHAANVLLVYLLATRLIGGFWPSVFLTGLWAVHPLLTESVTNMVGRADLLAALAVLGGLAIYLKSTEASGWPRVAWLAGLALVGAAGFFSKESAVVLLGVIALLELTWWSRRRQVRGLLRAALALLPPLGLMLYQRAVVLRASPPADFPFTDNPLVAAGFWTGKLTAIKVIAHYFWLSVWPARLSADYSYSQIRISSGTVQDWLAWFTVAAVVAGVVCLYRAHRTAFFLACFAFVTLLPGSNLIFPAGTIMAERFMYLPSIGLLGCLVLGIFAAAERTGNRRLAPLLLALIGTGFAVRTLARNRDWHDDVSLGLATVRSAPESFKAHKILAVALMESDPGRTGIDREIDEAQKSISLVDSLPDFRSDPAIYRLAARLYLEQGDDLRRNDPLRSTQAYRNALGALQRNVAILQAIRRSAISAPEFVNAETGRLLSMSYERLGDTEKALDVARQARRMEPLNPQMYRQIAASFLAAGRTEEAATALLEGMIVTQDMDLRRELVNLYQSRIDSSGCAIVPGPNGPAINPSCAIIHQHLCAIAADAIRVRLETGRRDIAEQLKRSFLHDYGCPAGPINQILPD